MDLRIWQRELFRKISYIGHWQLSHIPYCDRSEPVPPKKDEATPEVKNEQWVVVELPLSEYVAGATGPYDSEADARKATNPLSGHPEVPKRIVRLEAPRPSEVSERDRRKCGA